MAEEWFNWSDECSVGIEEIDEQHMKLFILCNKLHQAIVNKAGTKACVFILNELVDYTVTHFSLEETMMRIGAYPGYQEHCAQHKALVDEVSALQQKIASGQVAISFELLHFLRNWLSKHILREDMQYGVYFSEQGRLQQENNFSEQGRLQQENNQTRIKEKRKWWKFW